MKAPLDFQAICDDLKVCGRREYGLLIRMRHKYQEIIKQAAKKVNDAEKARLKELEEPEDEDAKIDRELEETMKRMEKEKKRLAKKEKVAQDKSDLRKKMSVIATTTLDNDEDLLMSRKLWDDVRAKGFENAGEKSDESESDADESEEEKRQNSDFSDEEEDAESDSENELDEKQQRVNDMADQMEEHLNAQKSYAMTVDRKMAGKEAKKKALIEQQRLRLEDLEEREALDNAGLLDDEINSDDDSEDIAYKTKEEGKLMEGKDIESSGESSEDETAGKGLFINPLAKKELAADKGDASEEWSEDDDFSDGDRKSRKKKKGGKGEKKDKDAVLGKRKRKHSQDQVQDFFHSDAF